MDESQRDLLDIAFFDKDAVLKRMFDNVDEAKKLMESFLAEAQALVKQIALAIKNRNASEACAYADSLHESAMTAEATMIKHFSFKISKAAESMDFESATRLCACLSDSVNLLEGKLRRDSWIS